MLKRVAGAKSARQSEPAIRAIFDAAYYVRQYPDIAAAGVDPLTHFLGIGWAEYRNPCALFDTEFYFEQNPDVYEVGLNPLIHYITHGAREGRRVSPLFDANHYLTKNPDIAEKARANPLLHYLTIGAAEGREANPLFDQAWYLKRNPQALEEASCALAHFAEFGLSRKLSPHPLFDSAHLLTRYPEVGFESYGEYTVACEGGAIAINPTFSVPSASCNLTLAVHLHLHYPTMAHKFSTYLKNIPIQFDLFISASASANLEKIKTRFNALPTVRNVVVKSFENRGRDIGPFVAGFGATLSDYDLVCHVHSKKSPHNGLKRDWSTQLLHHLFATRDHTAQLLSMFDADDTLGVVFPVYHHSLRNQISWGGNFELCRGLAARLGQNLTPSQFAPFPAGSFFFARAAAIRPLLKANIAFDDFPEEAGQLDGTLAHAIERSIVLIAQRQGFSFKQVRSTKPHSLTTAFLSEKYYSPLLETAREIPADKLRSWPDAKVCIFTCSTANYDKPLAHERLIEGASYVYFSDQDPQEQAPWTFRKTAYWATDPVKVARFYKTNVAKMLDDFDIAIWIDANVSIVGDITPHIDRVLTENASFGVIRHPYRKSPYDEANALVVLKRDDPGIIAEQIASYRDQGFPSSVPLTETNFLIMDLKRAETRAALDLWWSQINKFSRRDQISFDYSCWKTGARCVSLFDEGGSVRSNTDFAYFAHGSANYPYRRKHTSATEQNRRSIAAAIKTTQIVICVHNALDDVSRCLSSVAQHTDERHKVLVIDDNSEHQTAAFLRHFVSQSAQFELRALSGGARGYCHSANRGMLDTVYGDAVVLLNSDTIVSEGWLDRMIAAANSLSGIGIVGPLSNAASFQSLPNVKAQPSQTAVNDWPPDISQERINALCREWAGNHPEPIVPLVHGFCQLITRSAIRATNGFDESLFPNGYGEENDLCLRAGDAGFRHLIDIRTFIHHAKSKSYSDPQKRERLMKAGAEALKRRHGERRIHNAVLTMEGHPTLVMMREKATTFLETEGGLR